MTEDGTVLGPGPSEGPLHRDAVISLDASDVLYRVLGPAGPDDHDRVVVELFDNTAGIAPHDRSTSTDGPVCHIVPSSGDVSIALHQLGGAGPSLLICHATGFHGLAYAPVAKYLTDRFAVWALDFRGHGASTVPPSGDFSWTGMADDLLACVDAIGVPSVVTVGHSMGGAAILLAELARPGVIEAAYLFEPIVFPAEYLQMRHENPMGERARQRRPVFPSKRAAFDRYASRPPLNTLRIDALAAYVEHGFVETDTGEVLLACLPESEARTFEAEDKMTIDRLAHLSLPVAVAAGATEAEMSPADFAPAIAEAVSGAVFRPHPELGHFGPLEAPDNIAADILDWFDSRR